MLLKPILLSIVILSSLFTTFNVEGAPSLRIVGTFGYLNADGHYVVIGELENNGDVPLRFVEVLVLFFDETGEQVQQLSVSSAVTVIHPRQVSPFIVSLQDTQTASQVRSYDVSITNITPGSYKEEKLTVIFHRLERSGDNIIVSGRIVNDGSSVSSSTRATVVLYNAVGEPVRYASTFTDPRDILPFGSALFSVTIRAANLQNIGGYAISSESGRYAETGRLVEFERLPLERIREVATITNLVTSDINNRPTATIRVQEPIFVGLNITNTSPEKLDYTYILQIKDQNGFTSSISWSVGVLSPRESRVASIAWVPDELGTYALEVFVWKGVEEPVPLAFTTLRTNLQVV